MNTNSHPHYHNNPNTTATMASQPSTRDDGAYHHTSGTCHHGVTNLPAPPTQGATQRARAIAPALPPKARAPTGFKAGNAALDPAATQDTADVQPATRTGSSPNYAGAGCGAGAGSDTSTACSAARSQGLVNAANRCPVSVVQLILSYLGDWRDMLQAGTVCRTWEYAFVHLPAHIRIQERLTTWCVASPRCRLPTRACH